VPARVRGRAHRTSSRTGASRWHRRARCGGFGAAAVGSGGGDFSGEQRREDFCCDRQGLSVVRTFGAARGVD
jgi:hypothetical protein